MVQIEHRYDRSILFEADVTSIKDAVSAAAEEKVSLRWADLGGVYLGGAQLSGIDLSNADLYGADLSAAQVSGALLYGADLRRANCNCTDFLHTNLSGARIVDANLDGARLYGANIVGTDLIDAGQDSRGFRFVGHRRFNGVWVLAGCHYFPLEQAHNHWAGAHSRNGPLHNECCGKVQLIERCALARGWLK